MDKTTRIKELIQQLNKASNEYYNGLKCSMTDVQWDSGFDELTQLESETLTIFRNSPTQNAGYEVANNLTKIKHSTPLLSLSKTKDVNKLLEFLGDKEGCLTYKLDGGTQILDYKKTRLNYLATRGSSSTNEGQDITHNARSIIGIPERIGIVNVQVVGEGVMYKSKLDEINSSLLDEDKYANARNLANATSSMLDSKRVAERDIRFIAFGTLERNIFRTKIDELNYLSEEGFRVVEHVLVTKDNLIKEVERMTALRETLDYDIDGLVLSHNDMEYGRSLGKTSHHFKNALAYKFGDEEVETILTNILVDVGKSGQISYVGEFETVELCGTQVSKASLSNYNLIKQMKLGIGDIVTVRKSNEIIPMITGNLTMSDTYEKALQCPECGSELLHVGVHQFCKNYQCDRQVLGRLVHWCSRDAVNIEGMSEQTIKAIRELRHSDEDRSALNTISDLYDIIKNREVVESLEGFGKKKVDKICNGLLKSKSMPLDRVLYGLSIPQCGRTASKKIANHFMSMDNIFDKELNPFIEDDIVNLVGKSVGDSFINNFYNNSDVTCMVDSLINKGFTMTQEIEKVELGSNILGMNICCTGKLNNYSRKEIDGKITSLGAKVAKGVSKTTNILICNEPSETGKYKSAIDLGIKIITEDQFIEMIDN